MPWHVHIFQKSDSYNYFRLQLESVLSMVGCEVETSSNQEDFIRGIQKTKANKRVLIVDPTTVGFKESQFRKEIVDCEKHVDTKIILIRKHIDDEFHTLEDFLDVDGMIPTHANAFEIHFILSRMLFPQNQNRRLHARALVQLVTEYSSNESEKSERTVSVDLSVAGAFVKTPTPLPIRTQLKCTLFLPGHLRPIACKGVVAHRRLAEEDTTASLYPSGMGVQLEEMSPFDRNKLNDYIYPRLLRLERRATNRSAGLSSRLIP